jgi:hypothetical protein
VRDLAGLLLHLLVTVARLAGPGGARSVVAESVLIKHQLLILLTSALADGVVASLCAVPTKKLISSNSTSTIFL